MSVKMAFHALVGFLALIGAIAMLIVGSPHNALVVSDSIETEPEPGGVGLTSHVDSGPNASEVTRHATSGQYMPREVLHDTSGNALTRYVPPDWIHNNVSGTGATSGGLSAATGYRPPLPDSAHADKGPDKSIYYDPAMFKHAAVDEPDVTHLVPRDFIHQANRDFENYTGYIPPDIPIHVETGPSATKDVEPAAGHYEDGPKASGYTSYNSSINFYHISYGGNPSGYDSRNNITHITVGPETSQTVHDIEHKTDDPNKTSYVPYVHPPNPNPNPSPSPAPPPPSN